MLKTYVSVPDERKILPNTSPTSYHKKRENVFASSNNGVCVGLGHVDGLNTSFPTHFLLHNNQLSVCVRV